MSGSKFQIFKDRRGEFRFRLLATNCQIILHASEGYTSKQGAQTGIASVKVNSPLDHRYLKTKTKDNKYFFALKAANGEVIGVSETYNSVAGRDNGVASVKSNAPTAPTEDLTISSRY